MTQYNLYGMQFGECPTKLQIFILFGLHVVLAAKHKLTHVQNNECTRLLFEALFIIAK